MTVTVARIKLRRDTAANWTVANPTLSAGEFGFETDTLRFKVGDGALAWTALNYESSLFPNGSRASPNLITAGGGITASGALRELQFIKGSPGAVTVTANPQITAGNAIGAELVLAGRDDTRTVTINNGTGLELNGSCVLANGSRIWLVWDGAVWGEVARNDV